MKKHIAIIWVCLLLLSGCSAPSAEYEKPVQFYYYTANSGFDASATAICPETRECATLETLEAVITLYLSGPESEDLISPFPQKLRLISCRQDATVVSVTFSKELANLNNLDLTLACGCITMTLLELTGAEQVSISAENELLNGKATITMDKDSLQLQDIVVE